jgi:hypothetical protein
VTAAHPAHDEHDPARLAAEEARRHGFRVASFVSVAGVAVLSLRVLPTALQVLLVVATIGGRPLVAWLVGSHAMADLPEPIRSTALNELDHEIKGSAQLSLIRWRWILQWLGITFVVMIVIFLAIV